jgi:hypothetical protein
VTFSIVISPIGHADLRVQSLLALTSNAGLHIDLGGDTITNGVSKLVFTILSAVAKRNATEFASALRT